MPATIKSWATMNVCSVFQLYRKVTWAFEDSERCRPKIDLKVMRLTVHKRACEVAFTVALRMVSYIIAKSPKLSPAPLVLNNKKGSFPYKCLTYTTDQALSKKHPPKLACMRETDSRSARRKPLRSLEIENCKTDYCFARKQSNQQWKWSFTLTFFTKISNSPTSCKAKNMVRISTMIDARERCQNRFEHV